MKLATYLKETGETLTDFGNRTGLKITTLHGYVSLRRMPNAAVVARIEEATGGKVRAVDFIVDDSAECAA